MVTIPTSTWDSVLSTTLQNRQKTLVDNVLNSVVLYERLMNVKESGVRAVSGGATLLHPMNLIASTTGGWYSGYDPLNLAPQDGITAAEYAWKQSYWTLQISGLEMAQNSGPDAVIDLMTGKVENAESAQKNLMATGIYSDGTAAGGKQLGGLQSVVSDTGLGTVGGINSSTYSNWQNYVYDFSNNSQVPGASTIQAGMQAGLLNTTNGNESVDLGVADNVYYQYFWTSMSAIQRVTDERTAKAGFRNLEFAGVPIVSDGNMNGAAPASHMYLLNTSMIQLQYHRERNMKWLPDRLPVNQDALARICVWAGNLTTGGRRYQAVLTN